MPTPSKAPQLTSISAPPALIKPEDYYPDYSQVSWEAFGGLNPPDYLPVKYGYNHLIDLRVYSVLVASILGDGTIDVADFMEISQGLDKAFKLEYIEYLIYSLEPVLSNVNWCILKKTPDGYDYKLSLRLRTYAIFDPWTTNVYRTKQQRSSTSRREKVFTPEWCNRVTNNVMLANCIMQDGTRYGVLTPNVLPGSMSDYKTLIWIGPDINTEVFYNILNRNYKLPVTAKQNTDKNNMQLVIRPTYETTSLNTRDKRYPAQSLLYRLTKPFLIGGMADKVLNPEKLNCQLFAENHPLLARRNGKIVEVDRMPNKSIEAAEQKFGVSKFINYYRNDFDPITGAPLFKAGSAAKIKIEKDITELVRQHNLNY